MEISLFAGSLDGRPLHTRRAHWSCVMLRPIPLKLHVRNATQTNGEQPMYELLCRMQMDMDKPDDPLGVIEWSLWKTYEDFHAFDAQMRARPSRYAKMMVTVVFAPVHRVRAFFGQDQSARFLEKRTRELDYYMQRILMLPGVGEFTTGRGARELAVFLTADKFVDCQAFDMEAEMVRDSGESLRDNQSGGGSLLLHRYTDESQRESSTYSASTSSVRLTQSGGPGSRFGSSSSLLPPIMSRKAYKLEIEDELTMRFGDRTLKRFKKRARAVRAENDAILAAQRFVEYVNADFEPEFARWLLIRYLYTMKNEEKKAALMAAGDIVLDTDGSTYESARQSEQKMQQQISARDTSVPVPSRLSRKQSNKEIIACVEKFARGNEEHVLAFKQAAKALGNQEMTSQEFISFLRATFGHYDAHEILRFVIAVVPHPHIQKELRAALIA